MFQSIRRSVAVLLTSDKIVGQDIVKAGMYIVLPVNTFNDGFNGNTWSERIGFKNMGINLEAVFMKKTKTGKLIYKEV